MGGAALLGGVAGTAAKALGGAASETGAASAPAATTPSGPRWGMVVETGACESQDNCRECILACKRAHNVPDIPDPKQRIDWIDKAPSAAVLPFRAAQQGASSADGPSVPVLCNHCASPPCVQVCPTGIDIRNGLQYECIGCAACIDGCNQVMDKMNYPRGLIRYSTEHAVKQHLDRKAMIRQIFRFRVLLYTGILLAVATAAVVTLAHRVPVKVDVIRDRVPMAADNGDGKVENVYRLQLMNTDETPRIFRISASGLPELQLDARENPVELPGATSRMVPVRVRAKPDAASHGSMGIDFRVEATSKDNPTPIVIDEKATERVRALAIEAFVATDCEGMARVDFFVRPDGEVVVNELNTIPGFTATSVYAKLFAASGIPYPELLDRLVALALERHELRSQLEY